MLVFDKRTPIKKPSCRNEIGRQTDEGTMPLLRRQFLHLAAAAAALSALPPDVHELRRFLCAGYMHNAAYLGGGLSVPTAWLFHFIFRARNSK